MSFDRRRFLAGAMAATASPSLAWAQRAAAVAEPPSQAQRGAMADAATAFMKTYEVPGLSIAITCQGRLVYDEAFGVADAADRTALTPAHRFRVASISKPITSVAIFKLIEMGKLALDRRVLGPDGVLGDSYGRIAADTPLGAMTVEHLLAHTAGAWSNESNDPMFRYPGLDHAALIAATLRERPLVKPPGESFAYSNFGYCLLGRVIEKAAGRPYADFVNETILMPSGAADMAIAGNGLADRQPLEVRYHGRGKDDPYKLDVRRMDSHGGWLARPADIARFASAAGGDSQPALLMASSVEAMTTPSTVNAKYAKGWRVNPRRNWWHTGHLAGTTGLAVRTQSRLSWAALLNTRIRDSEIDRDLDKLLWTMVRSVPQWRA